MGIVGEWEGRESRLEGGGTGGKGMKKGKNEKKVYLGFWVITLASE